MFRYCLFECRPEASKPAGLAGFLEIAQGRGIRKLAFPLVQLSRELLSQPSLLHSKGNIQKRGKDIFNVESLQM